MSVARAARKLGFRRTMTPNQIVAFNVAKARALRGWTQEQAAEALAPYLGAKLSGASFSALERSAWTVDRIKQFSADDLLALSRGFDLPIGYFLTPPPPDLDAALDAPSAPMPGLDPIVLLDAVLGRPENIGYWQDELLAYASATAAPPQTKKEKPHVTPEDLPDRIEPLVGMRAKALLRNSFGDLDTAREVLERLARIAGELDKAASEQASAKATKTPRTPGPSYARNAFKPKTKE
ncbi:MAG: helix-turn-helix domain-containing protein [Anaerolineales bacterium]